MWGERRRSAEPRASHCVITPPPLSTRTRSSEEKEVSISVIRETEVRRSERQTDGLHRRGRGQRHRLPAWKSDVLLSVAQCDAALRRLGASHRLRPDRYGRVREAAEFRS